MKLNEEKLQIVKEAHIDEAKELYKEMHESHCEVIMLEFLARKLVSAESMIRALKKNEKEAAFGGGRSEASAIGFNKGLDAALEVLGL